MKRYNSCHLERCINTLVATNCSVSFKEIKYNKEILLLAIYATCVYKNKHQLVCFCSVQFVSTQNAKDHRWSMNRLKISWWTNRQSELRGVATGGFPSVCVKARTKARSSSRRSSTSTNHQTKIATKINLQLSSSRRLIMLQKSSSAHGLRAYYHSFLPVQIKCHRYEGG